PTTAIRYSNLAGVLKDLGDYEGAKRLYEKAYAILRKQLGEEHPNTKLVKGNLESIS
ncbi:MAG TPA: tetratricopeptide repeat protein, partial [Bacteroidetes bacterium]|nr:tetratricopeptide repeat protein [Bacteroidota bacterium]